MTAILQVTDLRVDFTGGGRPVPAVRGVGFELHRGERLGLIGESGSGKSVTALALLGLLPPSARVRGSVRLDGVELTTAPHRTLRRLRGTRIAMVFQDPVAALNPVRTVGSLLAEVIRAHSRHSAAEQRRRARQALSQVGLDDPRVLSAHPFELSGGQRQRVLIALAIVNEPAVIVADEPTTALDVQVRAQVLSVLQDATARLGAALLLISHDLAVVAGHTDRVLVSYAGRVVETGPTREVLTRPRMPYTEALLQAYPGRDPDRPLVPVPGEPPDPAALGPGCPFAPRCRHVTEACRLDPEPVLSGPDLHRAACPQVTW